MTTTNDKANCLKHFLPIGIPTIDVKIDYSYTKTEPLPLLIETVLKLLTIHDQCSFDDIRSFLGLTVQESKILFADLLKKNLIRISSTQTNFEPLLEKGCSAPDLNEWEISRANVKFNLIRLNGKIKENPLGVISQSDDENKKEFYLIRSNEEQRVVSDEQLSKHFVDNFNEYDESSDDVYFHAIHQLKSYNASPYKFLLEVNIELEAEDKPVYSIPESARLDSLADEILSSCYKNLQWDSYLDVNVEQLNPGFASWLQLCPELSKDCLSQTLRDLFKTLSNKSSLTRSSDGTTLICDLREQGLDPEASFSETTSGEKLSKIILQTCLNNKFKVPKLFWKTASSLGYPHYEILSYKLNNFAHDNESGREFLEPINIGQKKVWDYVINNLHDPYNFPYLNGLTSSRADILFLSDHCLITTFHLLAGEITHEDKREGIYIPLTMICERKELIEEIKGIVNKYNLHKNVLLGKTKETQESRQPLSKTKNNVHTTATSTKASKAMDKEPYPYKGSISTVEHKVQHDLLMELPPKNIQKDPTIDLLVKKAYVQSQKDSNGFVIGPVIGLSLKRIKSDFKWCLFGYKNLLDYLTQNKHKYSIRELRNDQGLTFIWLKPNYDETKISIDSKNIQNSARTFNYPIDEANVCILLKRAYKKALKNDQGYTTGQALGHMISQIHPGFNWGMVHCKNLKEFLNRNHDQFKVIEEKQNDSLTLLYIKPSET